MPGTQKRKRWMDNMIAAARAETASMPWERGARRADFIRRRRAMNKAA